MAEIIKLENLSKSFLIKKSVPGFIGSLKGIFSTHTSEIQAINHLTFTINEGERVAFIGPNGAGKSTTIKILTGILHPTSGNIEILGLVPWKNRKALGYKIGTVFGQRTQLWYHLPPSDTFFLLSKIYNLDDSTYLSRLAKLIEIFEIGPFLHRAVKQLSLGERMRCELVASLIHNPQILFLDEPTIGLDINAKLKIRRLLNILSKDYGTTLFLTSHDTSDVEQVCERVIVLDKGSIILDSPLKVLKNNYESKRILSFTTDTERLSFNPGGIKIIENKNYRFLCEVDLNVVSIDFVIQKALQNATIKDLTIENTNMEETIRALYASKQPI